MGDITVQPAKTSVRQENVEVRLN